MGMIYAVNTGTQTVASGGVISFPQIVRSCGNNVRLSGGNVAVQGSGLYGIDSNFTFTAGAGTATIALYKDGIAIPGAVASVSAAANTTYSISIPAVIRQSCCVESIITAVAIGTALSVTNAAIKVAK